MKVSLINDRTLVFEGAGLRMEVTPGDTDIEFTPEALQFMAYAYCDAELLQHVFDRMEGTGDFWWSGDDESRGRFLERVVGMSDRDIPRARKAAVEKLVRRVTDECRTRLEGTVPMSLHPTRGSWLHKSTDFKFAVELVLAMLAEQAQRVAP